MKIQIVSELYFEFHTNSEGQLNNPLKAKCKILLLAGDTFLDKIINKNLREKPEDDYYGTQRKEENILRG